MIVRSAEQLVGRQGRCTGCHEPVEVDEVDDDGTPTPLTLCCGAPAYLIDRDVPTLVAQHGAAWASFIPAPRVLLSLQTLTPGARLVALALLDFVGLPRGVFPSQATLAAKAGLCERAVRRALGELEANGLVARERRHDRAGFRTSDRFDLSGLVSSLNALAGDPSGRCLTAEGAGWSDLPARSAPPTGTIDRDLPARSAEEIELGGLEPDEIEEHRDALRAPDALSSSCVPRLFVDLHGGDERRAIRALGDAFDATEIGGEAW